MKNILIVIIFGFLSLDVSCQDELVNQLQEDYDSGNYYKIIAEHAEKVNEYPAEAIYFVGMAYYMQEDDKNTLRLMELAIEKDEHLAAPHFSKGMTNLFMGNNVIALESFNQAIVLDSTNSTYYSGLGEAYLSLGKFDEALSAFMLSTQQEEPIERGFMAIPTIYAQLGKEDEALNAFYIAKEKISKESDVYVSVLYNIGLYELLNKNYDKSESVFLDLIELAPNDFHSYAKLIQVYYGKKEYEKVQPYKQKLYDAYEENMLKENMVEMFCFDQFDWNDKLIQVFERFAEEEGELYYKHLFYVVNEKNEIEASIQTENSVISIELGGPKYALGMDENGVHSTYGFIEEDFEYEDLKSRVIQILEKDISPGASSSFGTFEDSKKKKRKNKKKKNN